MLCIFVAINLLSDPPDGIPEGPGGWQSHDHDGVSRGCQHTPAWVFPLGAHHPSTNKERVQNTSRDSQSPNRQHQSYIWARPGPTWNCQAHMVKQRCKGGARQQGQKMTEGDNVQWMWHQMMAGHAFFNEPVYLKWRSSKSGLKLEAVQGLQVWFHLCELHSWKAKR